MNLSQPKHLVTAFTCAFSMLSAGTAFANAAETPEPEPAAPVAATVSPKSYNDTATAKLLSIINAPVSGKKEKTHADTLRKAEQVRQQLKLGANPNANDGEALTSECGINDEFEVIEALLDGGADASLNFGVSIKQATIRGDLPVIKAIMKTGRIDPHFQEEILLMLAAVRGHADAVEYYVSEMKLNPNGADNSGKILGNTAKAIFENWPNEDKARYAETLRRLVKVLKADISINDDAALMTAVEYGVVSGAEMLIDLGANVNARNGMALRMALTAGRVSLAEMLLKRGAQPDTRDILDDLSHPERYTKPEQKAVFDLIKGALKNKDVPVVTPPAEPEIKQQPAPETKVSSIPKLIL